MAKKYERFEVATEIEEHSTDSYKEALSLYFRTNGSATMYGINSMGEYSVIFSK